MTEVFDRIVIRDLQVPTLIGVYDFEREQTQTLRLDLTLYTDIRAAGSSDRLEETLDYAAVAAFAVSFGQASEFELLEAFAEQLCSALFRQFDMKALDLVIHKDGCIPGARGAELRIHRVRPAGPVPVA